MSLDAPPSTLRVTMAVLLAAGAGRRFRDTDPAASGHKLLALLGGRPLVAHALTHALESGLHLVVVTGAEPRVAEIAREVADALDAGDRLTVVHHPGWATGQAGSLARGVASARASGADAVVVGLGDQPFVTAAAWRTVAGSSAPLAVATYDGVRGHPVRLASEMWPLLPSDGDAGARHLMRLRPDLVEEVPCQGSADDVDTVEDLQRWN